MSSKALAFSLLLAAPLSGVVACNPDTGEPRQMIFLEAAGKNVDFWEMVPGQIREVELPNGRMVGVSVAPALPQKYLEKVSSGRFSPELVEIRLYERNGTELLETHMSWGGANSVQGFTDFTLNLLKPVCYQPAVRPVSG